jgi:hypothetical protein
MNDLRNPASSNLQFDSSSMSRFRPVVPSSGVLQAASKGITWKRAVWGPKPADMSDSACSETYQGPHTLREVAYLLLEVFLAVVVESELAAACFDLATSCPAVANRDRRAGHRLDIPMDSPEKGKPAQKKRRTELQNRSTWRAGGCCAFQVAESGRKLLKEAMLVPGRGNERRATSPQAESFTISALEEENIDLADPQRACVG